MLFVEISSTGKACSASDIYKVFDMEAIEERRLLSVPHYEPIDMNVHATLESESLDSLIQLRYFRPDEPRTPKKEILLVRRNSHERAGLPDDAVEGCDMPEEEDTIWVSVGKGHSESELKLAIAQAEARLLERELSRSQRAHSSLSGIASVLLESESAPAIGTVVAPLSSSVPASSFRGSLQVASSPRSSVQLERRNRRAALLNAFGESSELRKARLRNASPYCNEPLWDMISIIFKGGDDCRQEALAMQLIILFDDIFRQARLPLKLRPYNVLVTSATSGLIETVPNAVSIDSLKKNVRGYTTLSMFFQDAYGGGNKNSPHFEQAQRNFVESMAAYSVVCYLLQIKDRHNGNILLDNRGHIVHIDFGFMLSNSPGRNMNWEASPFKLTREFVEVMDGEDSDQFNYFKMLFIRGLLEARKHVQKVMALVEISMLGSNMACFCAGPTVITALKQRFMLHLSNEEDVMEHCIHLVEESIDNWTSRIYDDYQRMTNGIL